MSPQIHIPAPKDESQDNSVGVDDQNITIRLSSPTLIIAFIIILSICASLLLAWMFLG